MATVEDARKALAEALSPILAANLPQTEGYQIRLEILENGEKRLGCVSREVWNAESGEIRIKFGAAPDQEQGVVTGAIHGNVADYDEFQTPEYVYTEQDFNDLTLLLRGAERGWKPNPVPLRYFLERHSEGLAHRWCRWYEHRAGAVRRAIEEGIILVSKIPSHDNPEVQVRGIRLNRDHPFVLDVFERENRFRANFKPVEIRGEPLSQTVIEGRG